MRSSYPDRKNLEGCARVGVGNLVELETHRVSLCIPKGMVTWEGRGGCVVQVVMSQLEILQGW